MPTAKSGDGTRTKRRVLVVDDDVDFGESLVDVLVSRGYSTQFAPSAEAALEIARSAPVDAALVDVRLGSSNGIDLVGQLTSVQPKIMCVIVTAYGDVDAAVQSMRNGASDFLHKPIDVRVLFSSLESCFSRLELIREKAAAEAALQRERVAFERRLRDSQRTESLGRLAGGIAHDFNNILTTIVANIELVQESQPFLSGAAQRRLGEVQAAANRAAALTAQLLTFARRQLVQPSVLDVGEILSGFETMLRRLIRADVNLTVRCAPSSLRVRGDAGQIEQVIMNLVINAAQAISGSGQVRIEVFPRLVAADEASQLPNAQPGDYTVISVRDDGCGIDEEHLAHIFDPFFSTKPVGAGSGLGLATVDGIARQWGGFVTVETTVGAGSVFNVHFPSTDHAAATTPVEGAESESGSRTGTILLCEDDDAVRNLATQILSSADHTVLTAADPHAALEILARREAPIGMLVTDMIMPGMDGRQLAMKARELEPNLKVLFVTGYDAELISSGGVIDEDADVLQKPFTVAQLLERVNLILGR